MQTHDSTDVRKPIGGDFPALMREPMARRGSLLTLPWERSLSNARRDAPVAGYVRSERPAAVYAARLVMRERRET